MLTHLIALAGNPKLIPLVYNYCDRWCEHCPITERCLVFAAEQLRPAGGVRKQESAGEAGAIRPVRGAFETSRTPGLEGETDTAHEAPDGAPLAGSRLPGTGHPLEFLARHYTLQAAAFLGSVPDTPAPARPPSPLEVIAWFHMLIAARIRRALRSGQDAALETPELLFDALGSAKLVLVAIDRSVAAWRVVAASDGDARIGGLVELLEALRTGVEIRFPDARGFVRPGLDELPPASP